MKVKGKWKYQIPLWKQEFWNARAVKQKNCIIKGFYYIIHAGVLSLLGLSEDNLIRGETPLLS